MFKWLMKRLGKRYQPAGYLYRWLRWVYGQVMICGDATSDDLVDANGGLGWRGLQEGMDVAEELQGFPDLDMDNLGDKGKGRPHNTWS